ncbi:MAG: hypothetical protein VYB14_04240, partial [Planctomycetota bacterium]|nr:hypothetical protein [Planctomycetota bacterium]
IAGIHNQKTVFNSPLFSILILFARYRLHFLGICPNPDNLNLIFINAFGQKSITHAPTQGDHCVGLAQTESVDGLKKSGAESAFSHHPTGDREIWVKIHHPVDHLGPFQQSQTPPKQRNERRSGETNRDVVPPKHEHLSSCRQIEIAEIKNPSHDG